MRNAAWRRTGALIALSLVFVQALATDIAPTDKPPTWQPPAPLTQVPLWPDGLKIARPPVTGPGSCAMTRSLRTSPARR